MIVLDVSGSMGQKFENSTFKKTKIEVAKESLISILNYLKDDDYLGILIFDTQTELIQEIKKFKSIDKEELIEKIKKLKDRGGTELTKAINDTVEQYKKIRK